MSISQKEILASKRGDAAVCPPALRKELNLFDAVAIVVGTIMGSGIFLIPSSIAARLNSLGAVWLVWVVGGILYRDNRWQAVNAQENEIANGR